MFTCPAPIPDDIREAMDALCLEVGEEPPSTYAMEGELHRSYCFIGGCRPTWWATLTLALGGNIGVCFRGFGSMGCHSGPSP